MNCSVDAISNIDSYINVHGIAKKPIFRLLMDFEIESKKSENAKFSRLMIWTKVDICKFTSEASSFSFIRTYIEHVMELKITRWFWFINYVLFVAGEQYVPWNNPRVSVYEFVGLQCFIDDSEWERRIRIPQRSV